MLQSIKSIDPVKIVAITGVVIVAAILWKFILGHILYGIGEAVS